MRHVRGILLLGLGLALLATLATLPATATVPAAEPGDLAAVRQMAESGALSLDGLITHRVDARDADAAYRTAFGEPACLKMVLDWRSCR